MGAPQSEKAAPPANARLLALILAGVLARLLARLAARDGDALLLEDLECRVLRLADGELLRRGDGRLERRNVLIVRLALDRLRERRNGLFVRLALDCLRERRDRRGFSLRLEDGLDFGDLLAQLGRLLVDRLVVDVDEADSCEGRLREIELFEEGELRLRLELVKVLRRSRVLAERHLDRGPRVHLRGRRARGSLEERADVARDHLLRAGGVGKSSGAARDAQNTSEKTTKARQCRTDRERTRAKSNT
jgi:hypothetical protein